MRPRMMMFVDLLVITTVFLTISSVSSQDSCEPQATLSHHIMRGNIVEWSCSVTCASTVDWILNGTNCTAVPVGDRRCPGTTNLSSSSTYSISVLTYDNIPPFCHMVVMCCGRSQGRNDTCSESRTSFYTPHNQDKSDPMDGPNENTTASGDGNSCEPQATLSHHIMRGNIVEWSCNVTCASTVDWILNGTNCTAVPVGDRCCPGTTNLSSSSTYSISVRRYDNIPPFCHMVVMCCGRSQGTNDTCSESRTSFYTPHNQDKSSGDGTDQEDKPSENTTTDGRISMASSSGVDWSWIILALVVLCLCI